MSTPKKKKRPKYTHQQRKEHFKSSKYSKDRYGKIRCYEFTIGQCQSNNCNLSHEISNYTYKQTQNTTNKQKKTAKNKQRILTPITPTPKRRSRAKRNSAKLKKKLSKPERQIVDCCLCNKFKGTYKGYRSHLKVKHEGHSIKEHGIFKVVGHMDEHGRRINPKLSPFFISKSRKPSNNNNKNQKNGNQSTNSKLKPREYDIDPIKLSVIDKQLIKNDEKQEYELFCCNGDYGGDIESPIDYAIIKADVRYAAVFNCRNDFCFKQYHFYCLWKCYGIKRDILRTKIENNDKIILCPECIAYCSTLQKSFKAVSNMIKSFKSKLFGKDGRIDIDVLKASKHFKFSGCLNLFNIISFILKHIKDKDQNSIIEYGNQELTEVYQTFSLHAPEIFTWATELTIQQYKEWKLIIYHHITSKDGLLSGVTKIDDNKSKRKYTISFRSKMSDDSNVQKRIQCFWTVYDCAKSMPKTETLVENVGATANDIYNTKNASTKCEKVKKRVVLNVHYSKDAKKEDLFVTKATKEYKKKIGSHVLVNQSAKSKNKVIKRKRNEIKSGPFAIPYGLTNM